MGIEEVVVLQWQGGTTKLILVIEYVILLQINLVICDLRMGIDKVNVFEWKEGTIKIILVIEYVILL